MQTVMINPLTLCQSSDTLLIDKQADDTSKYEKSRYIRDPEYIGGPTEYWSKSLNETINHDLMSVFRVNHD